MYKYQNSNLDKKFFLKGYIWIKQVLPDNKVYYRANVITLDEWIMIENPEVDSNAHANLVYDKGDISKQMHYSNNSNNATIYKVIVLFSNKCFNFWYSAIHFMCYNICYECYTFSYIKEFV